LASFYRCLYSCKLREDGEDKLWWVPSRKGGFEVKSFYRALSAHELISFSWKSIWRSKAHPRVTFFAWTATRSKILTLDNLRRRGIVVVNRCWLCESDGESVDHLLLHCVTANIVKYQLVDGWPFEECGCLENGSSLMIGALRTSRGLLTNYSICFSLLYSLGLRGGWPCR
jgi:hypothetical protein